MTRQPKVRLDKIALAVQWACYDLMPEFRSTDTRSPDNFVLNLGRVVANNILLPLTAELALKGLLQKINRNYEQKHDLHRLFISLPDSIQQSIEQRFHRYIEEVEPQKNTTLQEFLLKHKDDFVVWRYLEADVESLDGEPKTFHLVICAILDEVWT